MNHTPSTYNKINDDHAILWDQELINLAKKALWDKRPYGRDADLQTVRAWLHRDVPLLRWLNVKSPIELRENNKREELMMALQVINNDIQPKTFFDHIKKYKEELISL